jgi:carbamoyl-phosphate synthase large subunit
MNNILITSAGKRVFYLMHLKKNWKLFFPDVFATDYNPQLSAACMIADGWFKVPSWIAIIT